MNLATLLEDHPASRTAIVSGSDRVSYGQLREEIAATRGVLVGLGLEPGDRGRHSLRHEHTVCAWVVCGGWSRNGCGSPQSAGTRG